MFERIVTPQARSRHSKAVMLTAFIAAAAFGHSGASADVLALYDFGTVDVPSYESADTDANSSAAAFTDAAGLGSTGPDNWPDTNNGILTSEGNPAPEFAQKPTGAANSQAEALTTDSYWSFTVTPEAGFVLNLESLTFDLHVNNPGFPVNYYVATSVEGFDTPVGAVVTGATGNYSVARTPIDLSGAAYQNLADPVEIRMYLWSPESGGTAGSHWGFDNITLNGTAVPEPGTLTLLAGLIPLWGLRSRRRPRAD